MCEGRRRVVQKTVHVGVGATYGEAAAVAFHRVCWIQGGPPRHSLYTTRHSDVVLHRDASLLQFGEKKRVQDFGIASGKASVLVGQGVLQDAQQVFEGIVGTSNALE
jgi:hypothetical protein